MNYYTKLGLGALGCAFIIVNTNFWTAVGVLLIVLANDYELKMMLKKGKKS